MERLSVRVKESDPGLMLKGFEIVYRELYRRDLDPAHKEYVLETLTEIARNCVNQGFGRDIATIKKAVDQKEKLLEMRENYGKKT